jgi:hypothetical protein
LWNGDCFWIGYSTGGRVGYKIGGAIGNWFSKISGQVPTGPASINTATTTGGQLLESTRLMQGPNISPFQQAMEDRLNPKPKLVTGRTIGLILNGKFSYFTDVIPIS